VQVSIVMLLHCACVNRDHIQKFLYFVSIILLCDKKKFCGYRGVLKLVLFQSSATLHREMVHIMFTR